MKWCKLERGTREKGRKTRSLCINWKVRLENYHYLRYANTHDRQPISQDHSLRFELDQQYLYQHIDYAFLDLTPCGLVDIYQDFERNCASVLWPKYTASHPERLTSIVTYTTTQNLTLSCLSVRASTPVTGHAGPEESREVKAPRILDNVTVWW